MNRLSIPLRASKTAVGLTNNSVFTRGFYRQGYSCRFVFLNSVCTGALILATEPLIAVLMLGRFGFAAWQYSLAFAVPCVGGMLGSRLAHPLAARFGRRPVMMVSGTLGACFPLGMALMRPGVTGLVIVMVVQLCVITSMGVFSPLMATYRLELAPDDEE